MKQFELNINNYTFQEILNLFQLSIDFKEKDLDKCKQFIQKLYTLDDVSIQHCKLFKEAYKEIQDYYIFNKVNELDKSFTNTKPPFINTKELLDTNSCYSPYMLTTKMITIHSEDRDILKYPYENKFEIEFPSVYKNIISIELNDITLPTFYYNISTYLQNNKLWFSIPLYFNDPIEIIIPDGNYNFQQLSEILQTTLNTYTTTILYNIGAFVSPDTIYDKFEVIYNENQRKYVILNTESTFILWFDKVSEYDTCLFTSWKMKQYWGLGYNLGFFKENYSSELDVSTNSFKINAPMLIDLELINTIYMEVSSYDWIDEINPYSISTNSYYNNDYNGRVNNAFAKLMLSNINNNFIPIKKYKRILPHIVERISKMYFRFRYHNSIPVDFLHQQFNFALQIECRFNCET
jgi:hypothetical protein